jgi:hypothetical protein
LRVPFHQLTSASAAAFLDQSRRLICTGPGRQRARAQRAQRAGQPPAPVTRARLLEGKGARVAGRLPGRAPAPPRPPARPPAPSPPPGPSRAGCLPAARSRPRCCPGPGGSPRRAGACGDLAGGVGRRGAGGCCPGSGLGVWARRWAGPTWTTRPLPAPSRWP